jgi:predicted transcriptional regulator
MRGFGELEDVVMDHLWRRDGTTTVRDIFEVLRRDREIAYTTVMSTMDSLHRKGWLQRERQGKAFAYWPTLTREQYSARLMRDALDAAGNSGLVLAHLLDQMSEQESASLRKALAGLGRRGRR